ncbi:MAG: plasmid mobilization protein [Fenollaria massiliensis]|uniref:plasmid mobilization protein n=1 Tax=Fenollaria TaxID=1686313 RepID=UPI00037F3CAF|nr:MULTISPECIES: hypothetical protein [Fenollaria]
MFRNKYMQNLKAKKKEKEPNINRKRNKILNFRVSEEEYDVICKKIELSGLKKQDYFISMLSNTMINIVPDYRLADSISKEIFQLAKVIKKYGKLDGEDSDILLYVLEIYEQLKKEKSLYYSE